MIERPRPRLGIAAATLVAAISAGPIPPSSATTADTTTASAITASTTTEQRSSETRRLPGVLVVETLDEAEPAVTVPILPSAGRALLRSEPFDAAQVPAGGFTLCHADSVPADVVADVVVALETWSDTLALDGPTISVDFEWQSLGGSSTLGLAGPTEFVLDPQLPLTDTAYPIALANQLSGQDLNGAGCGEASSEITLYLNSQAGGDGSLWNIGDDEATDAEVDLSTVVLHEVGHGLGLVSSARATNNIVSWPAAGVPAYIYDRFFAECPSESSSGCSEALTPLTLGDTAGLANTRLWFQTPTGPPLELYAPNDWSSGSSVSHLDEVRYPSDSGFSLMTPYLRKSETFSAVDPALQTLIQALGWPLAVRPAAPSGVIAVAADRRIDVDFAGPALAAGAPPLFHRVTVSSGTTTIRTIDTSKESVSIGGLTNGTAYSVSVASLNDAGSSPRVTPTPNRFIPLELPPFATAERAVTQLHQDLLGVIPSPADTALTTAELRSSRSLGDLARQVAADERLEPRLQVVRLYLGFFERDPDPAGLRYWFDEVGRGVSLDVVASSFAIASEFEQGQVVPDAEFIDAAYGRILDRLPDEAGRAYWLTELGRGLDRGQMLILFAESAEHVAKTRIDAPMIAVSFGMLDRAMTGAERDAFTPIVARSGASGLAAYLVNGQAYAERHQPR